VSAKIGATVTEVLDRAWRKPFTTRSDFARAEADVIAMAASDGFLTTRIAAGFYGTSWRVTPQGLAHLFCLTGMEVDGE